MMKTKLLIKPLILSVFVFIACLGVAQQNDTTYEFSVDEAKDFGVKNNLTIKNSELDIRIADKKIWETTAMGLPQVNGSGSYNNNLSLATQLIPAEFFGGTPGTFAEVQFGTKHNFSGTIAVSQLIFSGPYIVGLQAARIYKQLSENNLEDSQNELKANIEHTYYLLLLSDHSKEILDGNLKNLKTTLDEMKVMFENGLIEDIDVDQVSVSYNALENTLNTIDRQKEQVSSLLKILLGIQITEEFVLTSRLESIIEEIEINDIMNQEFILQNNPQYKLLQTQEELSKLNLKQERSNYLPSLSGFYNFQENAMRNEFNPTSSDEKWFKSEIIGLQLEVPIFSSGMRRSKVQQAKMEYQKSKNLKEFTALNIENSLLQARNDLLSSYEKYQNDKKNMELAKKITNKTIIKYQEGVASSSDITQANDKYLQTQSTYINSLVELLNAKVQLNKLLNNL